MSVVVFGKFERGTGAQHMLEVSQRFKDRGTYKQMAKLFEVHVEANVEANAHKSVKEVHVHDNKQ